VLFQCKVRSLKHHKSQPVRAARSLTFEHQEDRSVSATFAVLNLQNSGVGSLRQALVSANSHAGPDVISFSVAGTIHLTTR
jgi:hypothetical protein